MPRIPKSFNIKEIYNWVDDYIEQLPKEIQARVEKGNIYDVFRLGLAIGVINGICEFSKDGVTGVENNLL